MYRLLAFFALLLVVAPTPAVFGQHAPRLDGPEARYAADATTGVPTLAPELTADLLAGQRARRASLLAELERAPRPRRATATPPQRRGGATVFTVDNAFDDPDTAPGDSLCSTFFLDCTLRAALEEANATPGTNPIRIEFALAFGPVGQPDPETGVWTIFPNLTSAGSLGPLPTVTRSAVTVDGQTQGGASCGALTEGVPHDLRVALDGSLLTGAGNGLAASNAAAGVTFRGLLVRRFPGYGLVGGGAGSLLDCLNVGVEVDTAAAVPNADGVLVGAGPSAGVVTVQNSLVSGNLGAGVVLARNRTEVRHNLIGTDETGSLALGNGGGGVFVVGDDVVLDGNVVSANGADGITLSTAGALTAERAVLTANLVGLARNGTGLGLGNAGDGIAVSGGANGHRIGEAGAGNTVAANVGAGLRLAGPGNTALGNTIGLAAGNGAAPNAVGVEITAAGNVLGGGAAGERNVISGNSGDGVVVSADDVSVTGNVIGLAASGATRANDLGVVVGAVSGVSLSGNTISGNRFGGVTATGCDDLAVSDNRIGTRQNGLVARANGGAGLAASECGGLTIEGNVVAANLGDGVAVTSAASGGLVVVRDNTVGLGADGAAALGNDGIGILVSAPALTVRLGEPGAGNVVGDNAGPGIVLDGGVGARIEANTVGVSAAGTVGRGNGASGISVLNAAGTVVRGNLVSDNADIGVFLDGTSRDAIQGNVVGTDAAGTLDLGNGRAGIFCEDATDALVGGTGPGEGNTVAFNTDAFTDGDGVFLKPPCQRIAILGNSIYRNDGLGIDLFPQPVAPNDPGDGDSGANGLTNFPVITAAESDGAALTLSFFMDALPNQAYRVEFFANAAPDPRGYGEGESFVAATTVTTGANGFRAETITVPSEVPAGAWIAATATPIDAATPTGFRGTSEFSEAVRVVGGTSAPLAVTITPTSQTPPLVLPLGERLFFSVTFAVGPTGPSSFQYWTEAVTPSGNVVSPIIGPTTVALTPGTSQTIRLSQRAPTNVSLGVYTYRVRVGTFPNSVLAEDGFTVTLVPPTGAAALQDADRPGAWLAFDAAGNPLDADAPLDLRTGTETAEPGEGHADEALPEAVTLEAVFPNPARGAVTVAFALPEAGLVRLTVYDALGRAVALLADGEAEAGRHATTLDGSTLPAGTYLVRLEVADLGNRAGGTVQSRRLTIIR